MRKGHGSRGGQSAGAGAKPALELTLDDMLHQPLPEDLPAEMFTGPGLLALADLLPVMTAYVDRDQVVRFLNKPLADYFDQKRSELLGLPIREVMGEDTYRERKPLIEAAFVLWGDLMRSFNLKGEWLMPHGANESDDPGRTIYPAGLRMAEPGWMQRNWAQGEHVVRREGDVTEDQERHAREWLWHLENGRIGG